MISSVPNSTADLAVGALDHLLLQLSDLVSAIHPPELYSHLEAEIFRSTPGGHVRHLLDHVRALLQGLSGETTNDAGQRLICYDRRTRGTDVECNPDACLALIAGLRHELANLLQTEKEAPLAESTSGSASTQVSLYVEQIVHPGHPAVILESNALREIVFVYHHSIHHAALIAARLRQAGMTVPADFGIAPATLAAKP